MNLKNGQRVKLDSLLKYTASGSSCTIPNKWLVVEQSLQFKSGNTLYKLSIEDDEYLLYQHQNRLYFFEHKFTTESEEPEMVDCDSFSVEFENETLQFVDHTGLYEEESDGKMYLFRMYSRRIVDAQEFLLGFMSSPEEQRYYIGINIVPQQVIF